MANYLNLTKIFFLSGFNVSRKKKSQKPAIRNLLLFGLLFLLLSAIYNTSLFFSFVYEQGLDPKVYMLLIFAVDSLIVFITTVFQMQRTIFKTTDFEFLNSLPIRKSTIVAAQITSVYLIGLFEDLIITIPALVLFAINTHNVYLTIIFAITTFVMAIIPLLLSCLIGTAVALLTARLKHKNVFSIIFYFIFIIGVAALSGSTSFIVSGGGDLNLTANDLASKLPYLYLLIYAFEPTKAYFFGLFILLHLVVFALTVTFIGLVYTPVNFFLSNNVLHEAYVVGKDTTSLNISQTLMKKDRLMLFKNTHYLMNSLIGGVMYAVIGIIYIALAKTTGGDVEEINSDELALVFACLIPFMGLLMNSIASPTTASISLEGKNFEFLLSYPISPKEIINSKLKLALICNYIINIVSGVILSIVVSLSINFDIFLVLQIIVFPLLASTLMAYVGMLCNLRWPKLEFENEMQVIKNSAAANFSMLFVSLPTLFVGLIIFGISLSLGTMFGLIAGIIVYGIALLIVIIQFKLNSERLFKKVLSR